MLPQRGRLLTACDMFPTFLYDIGYVDFARVA